MTERRAAALFGDSALLERAISYTLGNLHMVTATALSRPTPCSEWDLRELLAHLNDSLLALCDALSLGRVGLSPADDPGGAGDLAADPVAMLRTRAGQLLGAWAGTHEDLVSVGGCPLPNRIVACAGAVEVAVHGWDVAHACGYGRPIPPGLAEELLRLSPLLVTAADRPARFAWPVIVPPPASPGDRLLAFLGRAPR
jgi:uncharacterized protein (TIGR03086 family)